MLSRGRGLLRAVAKGVRRTSSKFGARLEPFMVADVQLFEGRSLDTVTQAETLGAYGPAISADYERYRAGSVIVETAERLAEGDPSPEQFDLLVGALRTLAQGKIAPELVREGYVLRAMALAGWTPGLERCVHCGKPLEHEAMQQPWFSVQHGGLLCADDRAPGLPRLHPDTLRLLQAQLGGDWETASASGERAREQAADVVAAWTQWHLERGLRSLRQ